MKPDTTFTVEQRRQAEDRLDLPRLFERAKGGAKTLAEAQEILDGIKKEAKANYRKWALELHPDRAGEGREEELQCLNTVWAVVEALKPQQRAQPRPVVQMQTVRVVHMRVNMSGGFSDGGFTGMRFTTDSGTGTGGW